MKAETRAQLRNRLRRIGGQVAGLEQMLDDDRYCVDILTQVAAVRSAIDAVGIELLTSHLETCVVGHGGPGEHACAQPLSKEELVAEVRSTLDRFLR
ncbi:MAG: metal-sensitive transcriptional regulator [Capsulimonadaceae bacterium]